MQQFGRATLWLLDHAAPLLYGPQHASGLPAIQSPHFPDHDSVGQLNCTHLQQADAGGRLRQQHQIDATRQRGATRGAVPAASAASCCRQQALCRQVHRHQGAGARGVRADAGALSEEM